MYAIYKPFVSCALNLSLPLSFSLSFSLSLSRFHSRGGSELSIAVALRLESTSVIIQRNGIRGLLRIIRILGIYPLPGTTEKRGKERRTWGGSVAKVTGWVKSRKEEASPLCRSRSCSSCSLLLAPYSYPPLLSRCCIDISYSRTLYRLLRDDECTLALSLPS